MAPERCMAGCAARLSAGQVRACRIVEGQQLRTHYGCVAPVAITKFA